MSELSRQRTVSRPTYGRQALEVLFDVVLITSSYYLAYWIRFNADQLELNHGVLIQSLPIVLACQVVSFFFVGVYKRTALEFRQSDITTFFKGITLGALSSILILLFLYRFQSYSRVVFVLDGAVLILLMVASRVSVRAVGRYVSRRSRVGSRVLIYGAGDGGVLLARELLRNPRRDYRPIGFIDDDPNKEGGRIAGLKVVGGVAALAAILDRYEADAIILATKKIQPAFLQELHRVCAMTGTPVIAMRFSLEPVDIDPVGAVRRYPALLTRTQPEPASGQAAAARAEAPDTIAPDTFASRPLRVAHVATRLNVGGVTRHLLNLYRYTPAGRIDMRVIAGTVGSGETEWVDAIRDAGVMPWMIPELRRPISPVEDVIAFYKLWRFFRRWKPDVVHTHMAKAGALGRAAALLAGVPVRVHSFHGNVFRGYFGRIGSWLTQRVETMLGHVTSGVVTVTAGQQDEIVDEMRIVAERRTTLIPYGCESGGTVSTSIREGWRRELGISSDAFVAVSVGRLTAIKNPSMFLEALSRCRMPVAAVIVGDGELKADLKAQARTLGIADRVVFAGWIDDVTHAYQVADALILTSRNEGSPIVVMEAMSWGCPIIATRVGGVPDLVDKESGILVDDGDAVALASALDTLASDRTLARKMGGAARSRALADFSVEREARSILAYYESLLASSHRRTAVS